MILAFMFSLRESTERAKLNGIYDFATRHGWQIQVFTGPITMKSFKSIVLEWQPDGCIVDGKLLNRNFLAPKINGVPIIQIGNSYGLVSLRDNICLDNHAIALSAAQIVNKPNMAGFGYISEPGNPAWSQERGRHFVSAIQKSDQTCEILETLSAKDPANNLKACVRFLSKLPKPTGILLSSDYIAPLIYAAAKAASLHIPKDISLISVDNDPIVCENLSPQLTSIEPDCTRGGYLAAERLYARLAGMTKPLCNQKYGIASISFRQSIRSSYSDHRVKNAIDWIMQHAQAKTSVSEVISVMGCQRRRAEQIFRQFAGKSIHQAIEDARFENVLRYVRNSNYTISTIADLCDFCSAAYLSTAFKKRYGTTIAKWRTANAFRTSPETCKRHPRP